MPRYKAPPDPLVGHIADVISAHLRTRGLSQSSYANAAGITQYQLNRILKGRTKTVTDDVLKLCHYANIDLRKISPAPIDHPRLREALGKVWDGRAQTVELLARLIECAGPLLVSTEARESAPKTGK